MISGRAERRLGWAGSLGLLGLVGGGLSLAQLQQQTLASDWSGMLRVREVMRKKAIIMR